MTTREQMDALVDGHYRAEERGDIDAIVAGFVGGAEHDVAGRPGGQLHGGEQIAVYYRALLAELRIDRFEPVRRWYGDSHLVDESILHGTAVGRVLGLDGHGRAVEIRLLHVFDFADGLISRESAWLDLASLQQQLGAVATETEGEPVAHLVDPQDVERFDVLGPTVQYLTRPATDDGQPCVMRGTIPPGTVVPLHSHADPETFLVVSGELEGLAMSPEGFDWVPVSPGDVFHVPGNARHAWRNPSRQPAVTIIVTTARMGRFFREFAIPASARDGAVQAPSESTMRRFLEASERYGYWNASPEENAEVGLQLG